jgi:hypothetical protein
LAREWGEIRRNNISVIGTREIARIVTPAALRLTQEKKRFGRGSWIRTNDLQYPKLPRYQAALYPDLRNVVSIHARNGGSKAR